MTLIGAPKRMVEFEVDGEPVKVFEGQTILDGLTKLGVSTPTLCYGETLTPANVCRVCVVEIEGARVLAPSCSRKAEPGMKVRTDSDRVRHSRKLVLEFLASSVDLETSPAAQAYCDEYEAQPERYGPPAPPDPLRDRKRTGHHVEPDGLTAATVHAPVKVDNELYVRDYSKCILCYKCVDACGDQHQNTFAITVAGRGFDARISTEYVVDLPESACVYCGNCIAVCPTGALMFKSEHDLREAGTWNEEEQTVTTTICPYCGVGCNLELHVQDNEIVRVTSPADHDVTEGNLCIKGRFGFQHVQDRGIEEAEAMNRSSTAKVRLLAVEGDAGARRTDSLAVEEPLEIRCGGPGQKAVRVAVTMRTPGDDFALAAGFLHGEGLIGAGDIRTIKYCDDVETPEQQYNVVTVNLRRAFDDGGLQRNFYATSSCGVCGKASIDQIEITCAPIAEGFAVPSSLLGTLPELLRDRQRVFDRTGGLHAAGLFDRDGNLLDLREDVGRHNALDKLIGKQLLDEKVPLSERIVLVSGRASFELVQKAAAAGVPVLCAISAPSSLAVEAATRLGVTLVGFLRDDRLNVYAHPERVLVGAPGVSQAEHPRPAEALDLWLTSLAEAGFEAPLEAEEVRVGEALGRVLQFNLQSLHDVPNTRCAAMDGFAVRAAEVTGEPLPAGAFAPIDTGEPVPDDFDAVVPVEVAEVVGDGLAITGRVAAGDHVRPVAEDISRGAVVLRAGAVLDAYAIGVAAGAGHATLAVRRRARVAVLATGDEIRPAGATLAPGETADANGPMLAALATVAGADVERHPPCTDDPELLTRALLRCAAEADLVLVIAGSSRGRRDRTPTIIEQLGDVCVQGVRVRPAHPTRLGRIGAVPVVLVPGYPVSAAVAYALFAEPLLALLAGRAPAAALLPARLGRDIVSRPGVDTVVPVSLAAEDGVLVATPLGRRASALSSLAAAHGFVCVRSDNGRVTAGSAVTVTPHRLQD